MKSGILKVVIAATAFFLMCGAAFAQSPWYQHDGRWSYQDRRDDNYNNGVRDGQGDRQHGRAWHPRHSGQAYLNGYRAGYGTGGGHDRDYRGPEANGPYRGPGGPYAGGQNVQGLAYNNGLQQGLRYGQSDRNNGHSYRPTYSSTYQNGTSGYNSSYGSETAYKQSFRQGFQAGYDRGYNGGGVRR